MSRGIRAATVIAWLVLPMGQVVAQERVAVLTESGTPVVATEILLAVGPRDEDESNAGVAHLGARSIMAQIAPALDSLGAVASVHATKDALSFSIIAAPEVWEDATRIAIDGIFRETPDRTTVIGERQAVLDELRGRLANPADAATRELDAAYFGEYHPWGRPEVGTIESVGRLTFEEVATFLEEEFRPDRAFAAVVGPVEVAEGREHLTRLLGTMIPAPPERVEFEPTLLPVRRNYNSITSWVAASYTFSETADEEGIRFVIFLTSDELSFSPARRTVYDYWSEVTMRVGGGEARIQLVVPPEEADEWADRLRGTIQELSAATMHDDIFEGFVRRYRGERIMSLIAPEERAHLAARQLMVRGELKGVIPDVDGMTQQRMRDAAATLTAPTMMILGPRID